MNLLIVSATSYENKSFAKTDPRRYLDSESVIFMVMPKQFRKMSGILGCKAKITNTQTGKTVYGLKWIIIDDIGKIDLTNLPTIDYMI